MAEASGIEQAYPAAGERYAEDRRLMKQLSHLNSNGNAVMVDVSAKDKTLRAAEAFCEVKTGKKVFEMVTGGGMPKGDVFAAARIAGIQAAKKTFELIPLCHNIAINKIEINVQPLRKNFSFRINCRVSASDRTGVEMEAMTGAAVAALTLYDMCKSVDKGIVITDLKLLMKSGGKSGTYKRTNGKRS